MRLLVTGSSGTIGSRLCETLLAKGHDILGADIRPNGWLPAIDARSVRVDLRQANALNGLVDPKGLDAVIHLAANARVHDLVLDPQKALDNITMLFQTLEWARNAGVPRFLFASSRECYGNISTDRYTEDLVRVENCESPYTASKIAGEALVESYERCYGLRHVTLRFSNVYGMYDDSDRVIPLFLRRSFSGKFLTVFGKEKRLDFTYIDDVVDGIERAVTRFDKVGGETFNIASGKAYSIMELAHMLQELTGSSSAIDIKPSRTGEVMYYVADIAKAKKLLEFMPKISFEEGVKRSVAWYRERSL